MTEEDPSPSGLWTAAMHWLRRFVVSVAVVGATVLYGVAPLLAGSILFGRHVGLPVGSGAAAVAMVIIVWKATRYPDVPGAFIAGLIGFVIGIVMIFFATVEGALLLIPSPGIGAVVGVCLGLGLIVGLVFAGKRLGMWSKPFGSTVGDVPPFGY